MSRDIPSPNQLIILELTMQERTGLEIDDRHLKLRGKRLPHGTLYSSLRTLIQRGWVQVTKDVEDQDGRLRFFKIDPRAGVAALKRGRKHYTELAEFRDGGAQSAVESA